MNAFDLFSAAFDSANDCAEATASYVQAYANGAFGLVISDAVAEQIAAARRLQIGSEWDNSSDFWHNVEKPLSDFEI